MTALVTRADLTETQGPYYCAWHDSGDGWLKVKRAVQVAQLVEDVIESYALETTYISPQ
jgi:hypothetical protein